MTTFKLIISIAVTMLDKFAVIRPRMQQAFDKLMDVPVDIEPIFPLAK